MKKNVLFMLVFIMTVFMGLANAQESFSPGGGDGAIIQIKGSMIEGLKGSFNATFQSTPVGDIVRIFAAQTALNIMVSPKVNATVTANFKDAPIKSAFLAILSANNLYYLEQDGIVKILTLPEYKNELLRSHVITRSYDASIIDIKNLPQLLRPMLTPGVGNFMIDPQSSRVIVTDVKDNFERLDNFFAEVGSLPKMVEVEVRVVQVDFENGHKFGINWSALRIDNAVDIMFNSIGSNGLGSQQISVSGMKLFDNTSVNAFIAALGKNYKTSLITQPRVVALNRNEAVIHIGQKVPYIKSIVQTSTTGQTTSQVEYIDVGVKLILTPMVSGKNDVKFDIKTELSDFKDYNISANEKAPQIITTEASCSAVCGVGQSIILGGLTKTDRTVNKNGIPVLMDIPVLEYFFAYKEETIKQSELIIILTPRVLENGIGNIDFARYGKETMETAGFTNNVKK